MTSRDIDEFHSLLREVGQVHGGKKTDMISVAYFDALKDIPITTLRQAKEHLVSTSRFWPKPVDWRAAAQKVEARQPLAMPTRQTVTLDDGSTAETYYCAKCEDTGWVPACGCPVGLQDIRGHCPTHGGFEKHGLVYRQPVEPCVCRSSNPTWAFSHQTRRVENEKVRTDG